MDYFRKLEEFIVSDELWPSFRNPETVAELENIAHQIIGKDTIEGYISSILLYQQIAEEMLWVLLKDCQAMIKISLMGQTEISFPDQKGMMFGRLIDELKKAVNFDQKNKLIEKCNELNAKRIAIVHGLTKGTKIEQIKDISLNVRKLFSEISELYRDAHNDFCDFYEHERQNIIAEYQADLYD